MSKLQTPGSCRGSVTCLIRQAISGCKRVQRCDELQDKNEEGILRKDPRAHPFGMLEFGYPKKRSITDPILQ